MRLTQFAVVETAEAWCIHLNGQPLARFTRQIDAVECAADLAASIQGEGDVEILVQDLQGEITVLDAAQLGRSESGAA